jgi:hypothetical protein
MGKIAYVETHLHVTEVVTKMGIYCNFPEHFWGQADILDSCGREINGIMCKLYLERPKNASVYFKVPTEYPSNHPGLAPDELESVDIIAFVG